MSFSYRKQSECQSPSRARTKESSSTGFPHFGHRPMFSTIYNLKQIKSRNLWVFLFKKSKFYLQVYYRLSSLCLHTENSIYLQLLKSWSYRTYLISIYAHILVKRSDPKKSNIHDCTMAKLIFAAVQSWVYCKISNIT